MDPFTTFSLPMRSLFLLHGGEYLVGSYIERHFPSAVVWVPAKDTGVDLLVTGRDAKRSVSLQVKFSRDYVATDMPPIFRSRLRACGWWTFDHAKLHASRADYWVLVLLGFNAQSTDFVIIPPSELLRRVNVVHGPKSRRIQSYVWVTQADACWETRGLMRADQLAVADGIYKNPARALTRFLNNWSPIERLTT